MKLNGIVIALILMLMLLAPSECQSSHYVSGDPAVQEMKESLEMPRRLLSVGDPALNEMVISLDAPRTSYTVVPSVSESPVESIPVEAAGVWYLAMANNTFVVLSLNQSDDLVFGHGSITTTSGSQLATASGRRYGSDLWLDIMPTSGMELYLVYLNLSKTPLSGTYKRIGIEHQPEYGTMVAVQKYSAV